METVQVKTGTADYPILIGDSCIPAGTTKRSIEAVISGRDVLIISDSNVAPLYGPCFQELAMEAEARNVRLLPIPAGEASKNIDILQHIYHTALSQNMGRDAVFLALGGGVVGDLGGFAAATFMRGVEYVQAPTSLLAMVDSSVGGKVGIDLAEGKNLVGAFYHPRLVLTDISALKSLPLRELRCGLAEIVKYGFIMDAELVRFINKNCKDLIEYNLPVYEKVVTRCCKLKASVVREDEREKTGRRAILNYGHTFGHAIECLTGYAAVNHGEAIAIGMVMASELACELGMVSKAYINEQTALFERLGLPVDAHNLQVPAKDIVECLVHDKKAVDAKPRFILPTELGKVEMRADVDAQKVLEAARRRSE
ncbi:MAG: 3-dehydroquinate synthase [Lentisphaeria bacterium]